MPRPRIISTRSLFLVDLLATFVFAIEGAALAVEVNADIDLFGMMVIAFATALVGGVVRDVLLGDVPPAALRSIAYPLVAFTGGLAVFVAYQAVNELPSGLLTGLDAAGLSLFAVTGAEKALQYKAIPLTAVLLGGITGVGGGVVRDVLLNQVPMVLRTDIYAVAALVGAAVLVTAHHFGVPRLWAMAGGASACFLLRILSVWQDWNLPHVR